MSLCAGKVADVLLDQGNEDKVDELPLPTKVADKVRDMVEEIKKM